MALVGVTTDGLPNVVRNQPFAFATGVAVCVFIVTVSTLSNVGGGGFVAWVLRAIGILLAGALASTVYLAAWGATEATAASMALAFSGDEPNIRYDATVTSKLLPSDDMLTVFITAGSKEDLSSCGVLQPELADEQPRRGVEVEESQIVGA